MLETACHTIASWCVASFSSFRSHSEPTDAKERQSPSPGSTVELGFLGSVLHVELPLSSDSQQPAETNTFDERFNPAVHVSIPHLMFPGLSDCSIDREIVAPRVLRTILPATNTALRSVIGTSMVVVGMPGIV
jgi:hypothetical protein